MLQTALSLATPEPAPCAAANAAREAGREDPLAFAIGRDHAQHHLAIAAALLMQHPALARGWQAGRTQAMGRATPSNSAIRAWLQLRLQAWLMGAGFAAELLGPERLAGLATTSCPVRRVALGGPEAGEDAATVVALDAQAAGYEGPLAILSQAAARAMAGVDADEARRRATVSGERVEPWMGLAAPAWWRVASLRACAQPLPFAQAAALPLCLAPPTEARLPNAVHRLQHTLAQALTGPGWAARSAVAGAGLEHEALRHDFNLFVGALAPRLVAAQSLAHDSLAHAAALEDIWLDERVRRRWRHLLLSLGEAGVQAWQAHLHRSAVATGPQRAQGTQPARAALAGPWWRSGRRDPRAHRPLQRSLPLAMSA